MIPMSSFKYYYLVISKVYIWVSLQKQKTPQHMILRFFKSSVSGILYIQLHKKVEIILVIVFFNAINLVEYQCIGCIL